MVTFGATCLYWSTSVCSVPPCVPGSEPFMPCQNVIVSPPPAGATGVAAPAGAVTIVGAGWAAPGPLGLVVACGVGAGAEHAVARSPSVRRIFDSQRMSGPLFLSTG